MYDIDERKKRKQTIQSDGVNQILFIIMQIPFVHQLLKQIFLVLQQEKVLI
jgi:hypothetical protein